MALDPLRVAVWRFEQIGPFMDPALTPGERHRLIRATARVPVAWPSGREAPVPLSTLYRWFRRYRKDPRIESLKDDPPPARACRAILPEWLSYALALVEEEPARSLYVLAGMLQDQFKLSAPPSQASLHRALQKEPRYRNLRNRGGEQPGTGRQFVVPSLRQVFPGSDKITPRPHRGHVLDHPPTDALHRGNFGALMSRRIFQQIPPVSE